MGNIKENIANTADGFIDHASQMYEDAPIFRALVQFIPGGGAFDVLAMDRANKINQERYEEFKRNLIERVEKLEGKRLEMAQSDEFFDLFRTAAEIAARTSDREKRKIVADYFAGVIEIGKITDLGAQVLEDLRFLQPMHLQVIKILPTMQNMPFSGNHPPESLSKIMPSEVYSKTISDLERFGFIRFHTVDDVLVNDKLVPGAKYWAITPYLNIFREHIAEWGS